MAALLQAALAGCHVAVGTVNLEIFARISVKRRKKIRTIARCTYIGT